ncbi:hypothetical protein [Sphingomonas oligophenolica]|uniref:Uncharacterized protein n=1 Tax=Sphingomonas oligophenolica TaxID=301154 RepID=A0A502C165_9SPHN|nr:hypothetical protein [Sphingomonas oligophenolica]TPG05516.1 hypothetical protein EAH84_15125 [Sphingomonas oligophenolica]
MTKVYDTPSNVSADDDQVHLDGPDGVAVSLTPEAALKTASRIDQAALEALIYKHGKTTHSYPDGFRISHGNGARAFVDPVNGEVHGSGEGARRVSSGEGSHTPHGDGAPASNRSDTLD